MSVHAWGLKLSRRQFWRIQMQRWIVEQRFPRCAAPRVLDLGADRGATGRAFREHWPSAHIVGVDVWRSAWEALVADNDWHAPDLSGAGYPLTYNETHLADAVEFLYQPDAWDVVVAAEILEHLERGRGLEMLALLRERVRAGAVVVLTTPIGLVPQGDLGGNPHQRHLSGWLPTELDGEGFKTYALMPPLSLGVYYAGVDLAVDWSG